MAFVERRGKRWRARYRGPDGRERSKTFDRRVDAERYLVSVEHAKSTGQYIDPTAGRMTLGEWTARWLPTVRGSLKPTTLAGYESLLRSRVLPTLGDHRLESIRPSHIQAWVSRMQSDKLSASRTRQAVVVLRGLLDAAVRDGRIALNPCLGVKLPKIAYREAPYLEPSVVDAIVGRIEGPYALAFAVMGKLGLRYGEAVALRRRSVDLVRRRLLIEESLAEVNGRHVFGATKSHAARAVPLSPGLRRSLERHLESHVETDTASLLFTGPKGGPLRYRYAYMNLWRPALSELGLPSVGIHVLRHSAAARLISAGAGPKAVQSIMGHRSAAFTLTVYGHMFDADLDDIAARLDSPAASSRPETTELFAVNDGNAQ